MTRAEEMCAHAACVERAPYGFGPPLLERRIWVCGAHCAWAESLAAARPDARKLEAGAERPAHGALL